MEQVKAFFKNTKKIAIIGLISSILICYISSYNSYNSIYSTITRMSNPLYEFYYNNDFYIYDIQIIIREILFSLATLCFVVYFIFLLISLYKEKKIIKIANYILLCSFMITVILEIHSIYSTYTYFKDCDFTNPTKLILQLVTGLVNTLYIFNILFKQGKIKFITNKVFAISNILLVILGFLPITFIGILLDVLYLFKMLYFYNYYKLLEISKNRQLKKIKGNKKMEKVKDLVNKGIEKVKALSKQQKIIGIVVIVIIVGLTSFGIYRINAQKAYNKLLEQEESHEELLRSNIRSCINVKAVAKYDKNLKDVYFSKYEKVGINYYVKGYVVLLDGKTKSFDAKFVASGTKNDGKFDSLEYCNWE